MGKYIMHLLKAAPIKDNDVERRHVVDIYILVYIYIVFIYIGRCISKEATIKR